MKRFLALGLVLFTVGCGATRYAATPKTVPSAPLNAYVASFDLVSTADGCRLKVNFRLSPAVDVKLRNSICADALQNAAQIVDNSVRAQQTQAQAPAPATAKPTAVPAPAPAPEKDK